MSTGWHFASAVFMLCFVAFAFATSCWWIKVYILNKEINKNVGYVSPICPEAPRAQMCTKFGTAVWVADVITCTIFWWSVEGCRLRRGSKIALSHWQSQLPLTVWAGVTGRPVIRPRNLQSVAQFPQNCEPAATQCQVHDFENKDVESTGLDRGQNGGMGRNSAWHAEQPNSFAYLTAKNASNFQI